MNSFDEKREFTIEILKNFIKDKDKDIDIDSYHIGKGYTANVWKISDELCLKVGTHNDIPDIPETFKECENLSVPLNTFHSKSGRYIGTIQRLLNLYSLQDLIKRGIKLPEKQATEIFFDVIKGLHIIHTNGFVHRDFYPGNIMLTKKEKRIMAVIIDFDEMQPITPRTKACFRYNGYQAPEIVFDNAMYDDKSEMFAFGVIAWELIFGKCPFGGYDFFGKVIESSWDKYAESSDTYNNNVKNALKLLQFYLRQKSGVSEECENLLCSLLEPDRDKRITAKQALEHPFFKKILKNESRNVSYENKNKNISDIERE